MLGYGTICRKLTQGQVAEKIRQIVLHVRQIGFRQNVFRQTVPNTNERIEANMGSPYMRSKYVQNDSSETWEMRSAVFSCVDRTSACNLETSEMVLLKNFSKNSRINTVI